MFGPPQPQPTVSFFHPDLSRLTCVWCDCTSPKPTGFSDSAYVTTPPPDDDDDVFVRAIVHSNGVPQRQRPQSVESLLRRGADANLYQPAIPNLLLPARSVRLSRNSLSVEISRATRSDLSTIRERGRVKCVSVSVCPLRVTRTRVDHVESQYLIGAVQ